MRRGSVVQAGDVIAVLSDEAREAQVEQARALATQRKTEIDAKRRLIESGALPKLELVNLESQQKAADAALAAAEAERERGIVRAPWAGVVSDVPVEVGQATFSMAGREIAQIVALDPMLAVVEAPERKLAGIKVGESADIRLVTGETITGRIRYVAKSASPTTRTYRIEVEVENATGKIPDGITAEVAIKMASVPATRVPRSALIPSRRPAISACASSMPTTRSPSCRCDRRGRARRPCGSAVSRTARASSCRARTSCARACASKL